MMDGEINVQDIRNVDVDDLLGRDPINVDVESILGYVSGKTVLVTGGGGSIGSELCRQLVKHNPKCLIIFVCHSCKIPGTGYIILNCLIRASLHKRNVLMCRCVIYNIRSVM